MGGNDSLEVLFKVSDKIILISKLSDPPLSKWQVQWEIENMASQ